jgi:hypothetical protein
MYNAFYSRQARAKRKSYYATRPDSLPIENYDDALAVVLPRFRRALLVALELGDLTMEELENFLVEFREEMG